MLSARDVIRLHMGHFIAPAHLPFAGAAVVVSAFLVRHPSGPMLLDTGIGVGLPRSRRCTSPCAARSTKCSATPESRPARYARSRTAICTSTTRATTSASRTCRSSRRRSNARRSERRTTRSPGPVAEFDGANFELLEGEAEIAPGVRIVPTPGHVPGHQSFVVETREGRIVIAGQAFQGRGDVRARPVRVATRSRGTTASRRTRHGSLAFRTSIRGASPSRTTSRSGSARPGAAACLSGRQGRPVMMPYGVVGSAGGLCEEAWGGIG